MHSCLELSSDLSIKDDWRGNATRWCLCLTRIFLAGCSSLHHADGRQSIMLTFLSCNISGPARYLTVSMFGCSSSAERTCFDSALLSVRSLYCFPSKFVSYVALLIVFIRVPQEYIYLKTWVWNGLFESLHRLIHRSVNIWRCNIYVIVKEPINLKKYQRTLSCMTAHQYFLEPPIVTCWLHITSD